MCTDFAVTEENQNEGKLELMKIVKVCLQVCAGVNYYITLEAKNTVTGDVKAYQTKVYDHFLNGPKVTFFRLKK